MSLGIFQSVGIWEVLLLLLVLLLVFGPKRLPEMGRSLGHGMREFKDSITGAERAFDLEQENEETKAALAQEAPVAEAPVAASEPAPAAAQAAPVEPTPQHAEPAPAPVAAPAEQAPSGTEQSS